ncbi:hypothetical protein [Streptomyces sp. NPDC088348]|uniref:hypothetical protein n=1 Tax=Streptomyces sp. NPDC088348 TaxID=3365853 RepID=UPI00381A0EFF
MPDTLPGSAVRAHEHRYSAPHPSRDLLAATLTRGRQPAVSPCRFGQIPMFEQVPMEEGRAMLAVHPEDRRSLIGNLLRPRPRVNR